MKKSSLKANVVLNTIKQCCSILFPIVTIPYVYRVLGADVYGKYNFGFSFISYFVLIAGLGINTYAIREGARIREKRIEISNFANEIFSINILSSVVAYCVLFLTLILWRKLDAYSRLILVQSSSIVLNTLGIDWINSIYEDFKYITIRYILFQVIALVLLFVFVKTPDDYIKYASINVFANSGANILNFFYTRNKYFSPHLILNKKIFKHLRPIMILFVNTLAVTIYINSDITLIGVFMTDTDVGIYSAAVKIYSIIKQILNAIIMVIIPRIAYYIGSKQTEKYNVLLNKTINVIFCLIFPSIVGTFILSDSIISVMGGMEYISGTVPLKVLCISLCFAVLACFYTNAILITNKQEKIVMIVTICSAMVNIVLNIFFIPLLGIVGASITTVIAEMIVCIVSIIKARKLCHIEYSLACYLQYIVACLVMGIVVYIIKLNVLNVFMSLAFSIMIGVTCYFGLLIVMKNKLAIWGFRILEGLFKGERKGL